MIISDEPPPKFFKLQVQIPWELYEQLRALTDINSPHLDGRIYGGLSRITILALRKYLEDNQFKPEELV